MNTPPQAERIAAELAEAFTRDQELAEQLNDAEHRLQHANTNLWSGLHPDAVSLIYDNAGHVMQSGSLITALMLDALREGATADEVEIAVLPKLQETHWTIHRAFIDYQRIAEDRRRLAIDVGELSRELTDTLTAAGWTEEQARNANVDELAKGTDA